MTGGEKTHRVPFVLIRYQGEPDSKPIGVIDLVEAVIQRIDFSRDHDPDYLNLRIKIIFELVVGTDPELWEKFQFVFRKMKNWKMPYEDALEVPSGPDTEAQIWLIKNMKVEIEEAKSKISSIHEVLLKKLIELMSSEINESVITFSDLVKKGLPATEPDYDWMENY